MRRTLITMTIIMTALLTLGARAGSDWKVARRITIGGEGGWDCLTYDPDGKRVFVTHSTQVEVVDASSGKKLGQITHTPGVHAVALAPAFGHGFTTNGRDSTVTMFDLATLAELSRIPIGARNPDVVTYDAASKHVFTMNGGSDNATVISADSGRVVGGFALDGRPEFAVPDGKGRMYVNLEDSSAVEVFDTRTLTKLARWPLAPGEEPSGIALDTAHGRLFSACSNKTLVVLDVADGHVVTTVPIGGGVDGCAFDAKHGLVFVPNGADSTLSVFHQATPDRYEKVVDVPTQRGARTLALDQANSRVFLVTASFGPPPPPTAERPHPRPSIVPGTFTLLEVGH